MADLAILIPVLDRPMNVLPLVDSIAKNTTASHQVYWLCTRGFMAEEAAIQSAYASGEPNITFSQKRETGDYATKINAGFHASTEPYLFLAADDLAFHPGWDTRGLAEFDDPTVGVVGTQDLGNSRVLRGEHSTHSFVSRTYVEEFGTIDHPGRVLHERYPHEFVDDEFIETAKFRGAFKFCNGSVVEHLHPLWGKAPSDRTYEGHRHRMRIGRTIYERRRHLWRSR